MVLDQIIAHKREELAARRRCVPEAELVALAAEKPCCRDLAATLRAPGVSLIAEAKRSSPSRGLLCPDYRPGELALAYARNGAAAISVLTDSRYFQGDLMHVSVVRAALDDANLDVPVLRKDFLFDAYQVYETRASGADALLLIAAVLSDSTLSELMSLVHELGMTALVEVHDESELNRALEARPRVVGINNRDLRDFTVDLGTFGRLQPLLPEDVVAVSESGVRTGDDVRRLGRMGADAVLVGEAIVTATSIPAKVRELAGGGHP